MGKILLLSIFFLGCASSQPAVQTSFRAIGHRGAAGHAPENTMAAFAVAKNLQVHDVELDIQLSRDGQIILFHDKTLDEKTGRNGPTSRYTLKELLHFAR